MREYAAGRPLVFSHVPKCAGTSLRTALAQALGSSYVVKGADLSLVGGYDDVDALTGEAREELYLSPEELPAGADLVAGHVAPGTTMARYPGADHVTLLRDPRLRVLSQWMHSRSLTDFDLRHYGEMAVGFTVARRPLRDYLDHAALAPNVDNTITRFLAWPHDALAPDAFIDPRDDAALLGAALERLEAFAFVDVVEDPDHQARLAAWLGREVPDVRLNERTFVPRRYRPDLRAELDPATLGLLGHRTRLDWQVWVHVARRMLPDADPVEVLQGGWQRAVRRYADTLGERGPVRPVRRTAEVLHRLGLWPAAR